MTRISKRKINSRILKKLHMLLFDALYKQRSVGTFFEVFDEIVTNQEKIIIVKRLGIIYLQLKGIEMNEICDLLKVSKSSVSKFKLPKESDNSVLMRFLLSTISKEKALGAVEDIVLDAYIQPGLKTGHYHLKRMHEKAKEHRESI